MINDELVASIEKSKSYLARKTELEPNYISLIDTLDSAINTLGSTKKYTVKFISPINLASALTAKIEIDPEVRSLYNLEIINSVKNVADIIDSSQVICIFYYSNQKITKIQQRLISLAIQKEIILIVLVRQHQSDEVYRDLSSWLASQECKHTQILLPLNKFIDLDNLEEIEVIKKFLLAQVLKAQNVFIEQQRIKVVTNINKFFKTQKADNWQKIKQIKETYLPEKLVHQHKQAIKQTFNQISQQQQQTVNKIKQSINQSKNSYLNHFMPDSWMFELQELIQSSQVTISPESDYTYLYLKVNRGKTTEYLHSYILDFYQQKVADTLQLQWSKIQYHYGEGGLKCCSDRLNTRVAEIELLNRFDIQLSPIDCDRESPSLDITEIVDLHCLKLNSRIVFDYKYTQSSWFKLLVSILIGVGIYLITKIYFGEGRYFGFVILIFQSINILTGQDIKTVKLKQHKKELQRTVNSKYQNLLRLIVDKLTQTLILSINKQDQQYRQQIDAIATSIQTKLDLTQENIERYKAKIADLKQDQQKILSWFDRF